MKCAELSVRCRFPTDDAFVFVLHPQLILTLPRNFHICILVSNHIPILGDKPNVYKDFLKHPPQVPAKGPLEQTEQLKWPGEGGR